METVNIESPETILQKTNARLRNDNIEVYQLLVALILRNGPLTVYEEDLQSSFKDMRIEITRDKGKKSQTYSVTQLV